LGWFDKDEISAGRGRCILWSREIDLDLDCSNPFF
jgi:hypothetical protein